MNTIYRELKECRYEAYCGRFRITSRGIGAVWAESLVAVECGAFAICSSTDRSLSSAHVQKRGIFKWRV